MDDNAPLTFEVWGKLKYIKIIYMLSELRDFSYLGIYFFPYELQIV